MKLRTFMADLIALLCLCGACYMLAMCAYALAG